GTQRGGNAFVSLLGEIEYGATAWWTTELYLDSQHTASDGTLFTGFRWENRFRPLAREHAVNPILYVEYEDVNGADKVLKEGVGDTDSFGLTDTSHYLAPLIAWNLPTAITLRLSPGWGLNDDSHRFLLRFGFSKEFSHLGRR